MVRSVNNLALPSESQIADFCARWKIERLELFGSALRSDFREDSDLDLLVTFGADASWSLLDHIRMEQELSAVAGRPEDMISRSAVERSRNWIRRQNILGSTRTIYGS